MARAARHRSLLINAHVTRGNCGIILRDNIIIKPSGFVKAFINLNAEMDQ